MPAVPRRDSGRRSRSAWLGGGGGRIPLRGACSPAARGASRRPGRIPAARDAATPRVPRRDVRTPGPVARPRQRERMRLRRDAAEVQRRSTALLRRDRLGRQQAEGCSLHFTSGMLPGLSAGAERKRPVGTLRSPPRALPPPETRGPQRCTCRRWAPSSRRGPARHRPRPGGPVQAHLAPRAPRTCAAAPPAPT